MFMFPFSPGSSPCHPLCRATRYSAGVASALFLIAAGCAHHAGDQASWVEYRCTNGRALRVELQGRTASVSLDDVVYRLTMKPASIGKRYASSDATLVIDGHFAAFVTDQVSDLLGCYLAEAPMTAPNLPT
jgi:hypothetical protein